MNMHVNPIVSDGQFSIGYDADGVAGEWPGNMADTCDPADWIPARLDMEFSDGSETYFCVLDGDDLVWANPDESTHPRGKRNEHRNLVGLDRTSQ